MKGTFIKIELFNNISFEVIYVEGNKFYMGDDKNHEVNVSPFYIGKYTVTQDLWKTIMDENPSRRKGERRPVEKVSWDDAQVFIKKLNNREEVQELLNKKNMAFRLPSEVEWEFAARGGKHTQGYLYAGSDKLKQVGWYNKNSNSETKEVGQLLPNELGLYDMSGNVYEWCEDDYHNNYKNAPTDSSAWKNTPRGVDRVLCGGNFFGIAGNCRSAYRARNGPNVSYSNIGFRLVCALK